MGDFQSPLRNPPDFELMRGSPSPGPPMSGFRVFDEIVEETGVNEGTRTPDLRGHNPAL